MVHLVEAFCVLTSRLNSFQSKPKANVFVHGIIIKIIQIG